MQDSEDVVQLSVRNEDAPLARLLGPSECDPGGQGYVISSQATTLTLPQALILSHHSGHDCYTRGCYYHVILVGGWEIAYEIWYYEFCMFVL